MCMQSPALIYFYINMMDVHQVNLTDEPRNESDPVRVVAKFRFSMGAILYGTVLGPL